jgi:hypothetical protein
MSRNKNKSPEVAAEELNEQVEIHREIKNKQLKYDETKANWRNQIAAVQDEMKELSVEEIQIAKMEQEGHAFYDRNISRSNDYGQYETEEIKSENNIEEIESKEEVQQENSSDLKITKTINGREVTRTMSEWIDIAMRTEQAEESVKLAEQERERQRILATQPSEKEVLKELGQKIQFGNEEEVTNALMELQNRAANKVKVEKQTADTKQAGEIVYNNFLKDYPDIAKDPVLNAALEKMELDIINSGQKFDEFNAVNDFDKRLRYVGDKIRGWKNTLSDTSVNQNKKQELLDKKMKISNLNTASQKQSTQQEKVLSEKDSRDAAVQNMFSARRKKPY